MAPEPTQESDAELSRAGADLENAREKFVHSLGAVEREIKHALDWRERIRRSPRIALALAFVLGALLGRRK
jgi:hypothetical protein